MHSTYINRLSFQKKLAISSLPFHQKKLLVDYLFAELQTILSEVLLLVILLSCDPIVIRAILVRDLTYKLLLNPPVCFSFSVAFVPADCCSVGGSKIHLWFFRSVAPFILTCCIWHVCTALSFCRKYLLLGCGLRKLGRTLTKMALEADFCLHVNAILTGWSSVIKRWSLAIKLSHSWGSLSSYFIYFSHSLKTLKPSK